MATIVNTPASTDQGANTGMLLGLVIAGLLLFALLYFGARNWTGYNGGTAMPQAPAQSSGQVDVNVPPIDVNVNNPQPQTQE